MVNLSSGQIVVFDQIFMNVGNVYNLFMGIFIVFLLGIYYFNVVLFFLENCDGVYYMYFFLFQNGWKIVYLFLDYNIDYWIYILFLVVVQVMKGDQFWLSVGFVGGQYMFVGYKQGEGEIYSYVFGFLIQVI